VVQIARSLHLSPKTVNSYRYRIFDKLGVSSNVEMVLFAIKNGIPTRSFESEFDRVKSQDDESPLFVAEDDALFSKD
jgi:hypothetical protein